MRLLSDSRSSPVGRRNGGLLDTSAPCNTGQPVGGTALRIDILLHQQDNPTLLRSRPHYPVAARLSFAVACPNVGQIV